LSSRKRSPFGHKFIVTAAAFWPFFGVKARQRFIKAPVDSGVR
jgi:hypothetical protein